MLNRAGDNIIIIMMMTVFPGGSVIKNLPCQCKRCRRHGFDPCVGKILWRRKWQPTPVSCPGNPMDRGAWWAIVHGVAKTERLNNDDEDEEGKELRDSSHQIP